jgi:transposase
MESLKGWLEETLGKLSKKSDTARAVRYALGPWEALLRFCDDGRIEIDNNAAERLLRAVVWDERISSLLARMLAASAQRPSTA